MRHLFGATLAIFLGILSQAAFSYEVTTHEDLSEKALEASVLSKAGVLTNFGLKEILIDEKQQGFPNSNGTKQSIKDLFRTGANFEDNFPRPTNHFYNPLTGAGLPGASASPDWAIDGAGDTSTTQFSFKAARKYMYNALTDRVKSFREDQTGLMFQSLGQVI